MEPLRGSLLGRRWGGKVIMSLSTPTSFALLEQAGGFGFDGRHDGRVRTGVTAEDEEDVLFGVAFGEEFAVGTHDGRVVEGSGAGVFGPEGEDGHVHAAGGGFVDDGVDVGEEGFVDGGVAACIGSSTRAGEGGLAIGVAAGGVVPDGDAALDDGEAFGLAVIEVEVDIGGAGVIEDAPGGVAEPEEGCVPRPPSALFDEVAAVVGDFDGGEWGRGGGCGWRAGRGGEGGGGGEEGSEEDETGGSHVGLRRWGAGKRRQRVKRVWQERSSFPRDERKAGAALRVVRVLVPWRGCRGFRSYCRRLGRRTRFGGGG